MTTGASLPNRVNGQMLSTHTTLQYCNRYNNDAHYHHYHGVLECWDAVLTNIMTICVHSRAGNRSGSPNGFFNRLTMVRIGAVNFR